MIWVYKRGVEHLHLETSFDNATNEYVLVIARTPEDKTFERFKDVAAFRARLETLEREMAGEHWNPIGAPIILRDGWKIG